MRFFAVFFFIYCIPVLVAGQTFGIKGTVLFEKDDMPLADASVFVNNGSVGTASNADGTFTLTGIPYSTFELVVSFVGYETIVVKIDPSNINKKFIIKMSEKTNELQEVIVGAVEKDGWKKWGPTFIKHFIGVSANAQRCTILNPDVLKFRHNKKTGILTVIARDKLQIRNQVLGYNITYQLEDFSYNPNQGMIIYTGYPFFENMATGRDRKMKNWLEERQKSYNGSVMHFMRSFYKNKINDEGFEMRHLIKISRTDSMGRMVYDRIIKKDFSDIDTAKYSLQLVRRGGFNRAEIIATSKNLLPADSLRIYDTATAIIGMFFTNYVQVRYKNEMESNEYLQLQFTPSLQRSLQTSMFHFLKYSPVIVEPNGLFYDPLTVLMEGYWSFEKIAELLPADYDVD